MSNRTVLTLAALGLLLIPLSAYLVGCEGGGGESGAVIPGEGTATGSVTVLIADGPADDYDHIWITITEISLIPPEGDDAPVFIYESNGEEIDLLKRRYVCTISWDWQASLCHGDYLSKSLNCGSFPTAICT